MNTCSCKCIFRDFVSGKDNVQKYFYDEPADHELMILDPLYVNKKNYFDTSRGVNSVYRRCLYGKDTNEHAFDYGLQFLKEYKDEKKMLYLEYTVKKNIPPTPLPFFNIIIINIIILIGWT